MLVLLVLAVLAVLVVDVVLKQIEGQLAAKGYIQAAKAEARAAPKKYVVKAKSKGAQRQKIKQKGKIKNNY